MAYAQNYGSKKSKSSEDGFRITGRTVLLGLCGFFGIMLVANGILVWLALGSFPGTVVSSAYQAGRAYPAEQAAAKAQAAREWQMTVDVISMGGEATRIRLTAEDAAGAPLVGLLCSAVIGRPTHDGDDVAMRLSERESGVYEAVVEGVDPGIYHMAIEAEDGDGHTFRSRNRIVL